MVARLDNECAVHARLARVGHVCIGRAQCLQSEWRRIGPWVRASPVDQMWMWLSMTLLWSPRVFFAVEVVAELAMDAPRENSIPDITAADDTRSAKHLSRPLVGACHYSGSILILFTK